MMAELDGKKVAFLLTDGFEDSELTSPWGAVTDAGAQAQLVSPADQKVTGKNGHEQTVDQAVSQADRSLLDTVDLHGGVVNADHLRMDQDYVTYAKAFF